MLNIPIFVAFTAGIVSFVSPCILPIIPGFLAYLAGSSLADARNKRGAIFLNSLFFVLGFAVVFAVLGVLLNSVLIHVAYQVQTWLARIGGIIIIFFGLYLTGLIEIPFFSREYKLRVNGKGTVRLVTSFLFGLAFAAGWTPCVGPVLGGILGLAAVQPGATLGLLMAYALGLGIPFLIVGLFAEQASRFIERWSGALAYVTKIFGVLLVIIGILAFTQSLSLLANFGFLNNLLLR